MMACLVKLQGWISLITLLVINSVYHVKCDGKRSKMLENIDCQPNDYHFEFTECDAYSGRWLVPIPSVGCENVMSHIPPRRLKECFKACEAGQFLNLTTVQCEDCEEGTYSLGGGIRVDEWDPMPEGFRAQVEKFHSMFPTFGRQYADLNCSKWGWRSRGDMLISQGGPCVATLTYTAQLVKQGSLKFVYQYADDSILFLFQANSEQCKSLREAEGSRLPPLTGEGSWRTEEISLHPGLNIFQWKTIGTDAHKSKPVIIKRIELDGVGYTSSCNPCPAGFFSNSVASKTCYPCKRNYFSNHKSTRCIPCDSKYYSEAGSSKCLPMPACTAEDYYSLHAPCNVNNKTRIIYKWIEPKICLETIEGAVQLPDPGPEKECPPCNPGTEYRDGSCQPCRINYFSDGLNGTPCSRCPANTVPETGHYMTQWYSWPKNVHTTCISPEGNGCSSSPAWQLSGKFIQSGKGHANWVYLVMIVSVAGFRGLGGIINGELLEVGRVEFTFEVKCAHDCELLFMQGTQSKNASVIQRWMGSQSKQKFTHSITRNDSYEFSWAFQKLEWDSLSVSSDSAMRGDWSNIGSSDSSWEKSSLDNDDNWVKIYDINVINSIDGGAHNCTPCKDGQRLSRTNAAALQSCITCSPGQYLAVNDSDSQNEGYRPRLKNGTGRDTSSSLFSTDGVESSSLDAPNCRPCPPGTVTVDPFAIDSNSCRPCGSGLISKNGIQCTTDCLVKLGEYTYDLRPLKGFHTVRGSSLFTASGIQYYHVFNISFCADSNAHCYNNVSLQAGVLNENTIVEALICQSTIFPPAVGEAYEGALDKNSNGYEGYMSYASKPLSTHASSLGDHLVGISHSHNQSILGMSVADEIHEHIKYPHQLHFFYSTPERTMACPRGRSTTITFRCRSLAKSLPIDQQTEMSNIRTPEKCPDATCDGCNFHFIWETPVACHLCTEKELTIVKGECKDGIQDIHYLANPNSECLLTVNATWPRTNKCQNHLPLFVEVAIQITVGLTTLLSITLICFWRRHRKLEYKYMKLMASGSSSGMGSGGSGEEPNSCERDMLPVAESCALDPNEDEDDDDTLHHSNSLHPQLSSQIKEVSFYSDSAIKNLVSKFSVLDRLKSFTRKGETGSSLEIMNLTDKEAVS